MTLETTNLCCFKYKTEELLIELLVYNYFDIYNKYKDGEWVKTYAKKRTFVNIR